MLKELPGLARARARARAVRRCTLKLRLRAGVLTPRKFLWVGQGKSGTLCQAGSWVASVARLAEAGPMYSGL